MAYSVQNYPLVEHFWAPEESYYIFIALQGQNKIGMLFSYLSNI